MGEGYLPTAVKRGLQTLKDIALIPPEGWGVLTSSRSTPPAEDSRWDFHSRCVEGEGTEPDRCP